MPRLLTSAEVAEMLGTSERHLKEMRSQRRIPFVKVGRLVRYRPNEITQWLDANSVREAS